MLCKLLTLQMRFTLCVYQCRSVMYMGNKHVCVMSVCFNKFEFDAVDVL